MNKNQTTFFLTYVMKGKKLQINPKKVVKNGLIFYTSRRKWIENS
jgi:hypothetical protein